MARLDAIGRLRVVEATVPGAGAAETVIDAPFEQVWGWVADLERSVPDFDTTVGRLRIRRREPAPGGAEALVLQAWSGRVPVPLTFDVRLEEGLCLMRARRRLFFVGMAAVADGSRTRFRHVEGVPRAAGRALRPLFVRTTRSDLRGIVRAMTRGPD